MILIAHIRSLSTPGCSIDRARTGYFITALSLLDTLDSVFGWITPGQAPPRKIRAGFQFVTRPALACYPVISSCIIRPHLDALHVGKKGLTMNSNLCRSAALFLLLAANSFGQALSGTVVGTVTDQAGAV